MLDEVWLRVRRTMLHRLSAVGFWPDSRAHAAFMEERLLLGNRLRSELLPSIVGPLDFAWLGSEAVFGASNDRFRGSTPFVLAFGHDLGHGLGRLLHDTEPPARAAAELCAVFNLGVSMFDLVCDHDAGLFSELGSAFDEATLRMLLHDPHAVRDVERAASRVGTGELRILLKVILWIIGRLHALRAQRCDDGTWNTIVALLVASHRAELRSAAAEWESSAQAFDASRDKSVLPFHIMHQMTRLCGEPRSPEAERMADQAVERVASIFWTTDDLVDVVRDFQAATLNSILVRAGGVPDDGGRVLQSDVVMRRLLEGHYIENAVDEIRRSLASLTESLASSDSDESAQLPRVVSCHVRNWVD
ncbi:MAG: hypothetical protein ACJ8AD_20185 [Gemmatimonadaceae bacterium]